MGLHTFHGILRSPQKPACVTHMSGMKCHPSEAAESFFVGHLSGVRCRTGLEMDTDRLIGAWNLVSCFEIKSYGNNDSSSADIGKLIYTADGHVSAQIVQQDLRRFQSDDWRVASEAECAAAWKRYFGYFGTYSVDSERQVITHHIEGAWFPNLIGTDQLRRYRFEDSRLVLDADTTWGCIRAIWKRASASS